MPLLLRIRGASPFTRLLLSRSTVRLDVSSHLAFPALCRRKSFGAASLAEDACLDDSPRNFLLPLGRLDIGGAERLDGAADAKALLAEVRTRLAEERTQGVSPAQALARDARG